MAAAKSGASVHSVRKNSFSVTGRHCATRVTFDCADVDAFGAKNEANGQW